MDITLLQIKQGKLAELIKLKKEIINYLADKTFSTKSITLVKTIKIIDNEIQKRRFGTICKPENASFEIKNQKLCGAVPAIFQDSSEEIEESSKIKKSNVEFLMKKRNDKSKSQIDNMTILTHVMDSNLIEHVITLMSTTSKPLNIKGELERVSNETTKKVHDEDPFLNYKSYTNQNYSTLYKQISSSNLYDYHLNNGYHSNLFDENVIDDIELEEDFKESFRQNFCFRKERNLSLSLNESEELSSLFSMPLKQNCGERNFDIERFNDSTNYSIGTDETDSEIANSLSLETKSYINRTEIEGKFFTYRDNQMKNKIDSKVNKDYSDLEIINISKQI